MKKNVFLFSVIILVFFANSCSKDMPSLVNDEGFTKEITNLVSDSVLDVIKGLGMPIYSGSNPPDITGAYLGSPFELVGSNISYDEIGYVYSDYYVKFYEQNNGKLTVKMDYLNDPEEGSGIGSYIVGEKNNFSVFVKLMATANDSKAKLVHIISGEMTDKGIKNMYFANFMLDNYDNSAGYWIENNEGRVIYDSDKFSELVDSFKIVQKSRIISNSTAAKTHKYHN